MLDHERLRVYQLSLDVAALAKRIIDKLLGAVPAEQIETGKQIIVEVVRMLSAMTR